MEVQYLGPKSSNCGVQALDLLLVWWFKVDQYTPFGVDSFKLPQVRFVCPKSTSDAFGFFNTSQVLQAIHVVPIFTLGQITDDLGEDLFARQQDPDNNQD